MSRPLDIEIGKKIRHRRWALSMTQNELACAAGVRFQQIQKYETATNRVSASRLWLISKALAVPITHFFEDAELILARLDQGKSTEPATDNRGTDNN